MLRAVSTICIESRALELISVARRDVFAGYRRSLHLTPTQHQQQQTVLSTDAPQPPPPAQSAAPPPPPPPPPPQPPRRAWPAAAFAVALTASLGGVYTFFRKKNDEIPLPASKAGSTHDEALEFEPIPRDGSEFPAHVEYLLVGAGTASFAAMRAIRSLRPDARVLIVGDEPALPYMRPPLSKELWREPDLATRAASPDGLTFRQWNGKRRPVLYEPAAFYSPVSILHTMSALSVEGGGGAAAAARGWRVTRLDVTKHEAELEAPGRPPTRLTYGRALVATGVRARRIPALAPAAAAGRSLTLRGLRDAARLARALDDARTSTVAIVGGGFLATELGAALADRLQGSGRRVVQVTSEAAPMAAVLPQYLAQDAARRLRDANVELVTGVEVVSSSVDKDGVVHMQLSDGAALQADLVVEAAGSRLEPALAEASGLEVHPQLGGLLVNAELQARSDVWAAGDAACYYDVVLGRRRVEHHDHAVVSGRLAGENMAATKPAAPYTHQTMFWSDLGPQLGYEAIGIIDSRLPTVGVFSADAVVDVGQARAELAPASSPASSPAVTSSGAEAEAESKRYERGVVFYLRGQRVVGVLLWNLFNRMHVARQVLAAGEFEDLFEVGKLFAPHEQD